jgi:hypothetical protein
MFFQIFLFYPLTGKNQIFPNGYNNSGGRQHFAETPQRLMFLFVFYAIVFSFPSVNRDNTTKG